MYLALQAGATLYKLQIDMNINTSQPIKAGDNVFKAKTNLDNYEIQKYRKRVLAGIDQIGVVREAGVTMTNVAYPDGWELPIPSIFLIVLAEAPCDRVISGFKI